MLVLSRKKNESIVIQDDIWVTVLEVDGDTVSFGIVAPSDVPVDRQEIHEAKKTNPPKDNSSRPPQDEVG